MNIGLFMDTSQACYNTLNYFMGCIEIELNYFKIHTERIYKVDHLLTGTWNALIMINNRLPSEQENDGTFLLDHLNCPVFLILVDPPYFHHHVLDSHMDNLHLILLDQEHVEYCKNYYPPFKSISMSYLLGPVETAKNYEERQIDILFTGTLHDGDHKEEVIRACPYEWTGSLFDALIQNGITHPEMSTFQTLTTLFRQNNISCSDDDLKLLMNVFGIHSELYLRRYFRKKIITLLVDAGLQVHVAGGGWEDLYPSHPDNLILEGSINFLETAALTANAKVSLNIMPWFKDGLHDRILTSMLNGSLCLTDSNPYIKSHFEDGKDIVFYDLQHLEDLPRKIEWFLQNSGQGKIDCLHRTKQSPA